ncbi:EamA family transporter [Terribacillus sp. DMT04]|uniref:EamA family transporter n=1 Tax=Terribacillus sp. DMT04 TaxID=2850441 RepID=UPI0020B6F7DB|nr:EamA family transporter [Terribacillus sp. DMT04]
MTISWVLLLSCTLLGAIGGFYFKRASDPLMNTYRTLFIGLVCYGSAALINIYVLTLLPYSVVFPLTAITYVWTLLLSYYFLKERIKMRQTIGVGLLVAGAACLVL